MILENYHTHTTYCDGSNDPEEMIEKAIDLGFTTLGFSGHSYTAFDERYCMSKRGTQQYIKLLQALRYKYRDKINIKIGIEQDYYSKEPTDNYDYVIGSVHYVLKDGEYIPVDETAELQLEGVNKHYNGDFYAFIEDYYSLVADVYNKTKCDIIGHFDLITKFNENGELFDTKHSRYIAAVNKAIDSLSKSGAILEVNFGAISRGYRTTPYPEKWIAEEFKKRGTALQYSSDCHNKDYLNIQTDVYEKEYK